MHMALATPMNAQNTRYWLWNPVLIRILLATDHYRQICLQSGLLEFSFYLHQPIYNEGMGGALPKYEVQKNEMRIQLSAQSTQDLGKFEKFEILVESSSYRFFDFCELPHKTPPQLISYLLRQFLVILAIASVSMLKKNL